MLLITGATGFVGRNLVNELAGHHPLRVICRRSSRVGWLRSMRDVEIVFASLETGKGLDTALVGVKTVVHLAGQTMGRGRSDFFRTNVLGTEQLIAAMRRHGVQNLIFISSQAAAGANTTCPVMTEEMPARPVSAYGWSKRISEVKIETSPLNYTILRPPAIYGPYEKEILKYIQLIQRGFCPVTGRGEKRLNLLYVRDLTALIRRLIEQGLYRRQIYFVSDGQCYTWNDIIRTIAAILDRRRWLRITVPRSMGLLFGVLNDALLPEKKRVISRDKIREMSYDGWLCSTERACRELGFKPAYDLTAGMAETIAWYRQNGYLS